MCHTLTGGILFHTNSSLHPRAHTQHVWVLYYTPTTWPGSTIHAKRLKKLTCPHLLSFGWEMIIHSHLRSDSNCIPLRAILETHWLRPQLFLQTAALQEISAMEPKCEGGFCDQLFSIHSCNTYVWCKQCVFKYQRHKCFALIHFFVCVCCVSIQ